ncbi:MAG: SurA N-terminal domain-containing protein [Alphaproteobacteria bacterium]|nr:SurA N-terminal domain-containing protein [Alphaproteobacteria bacterium]
MVVGLIMVIGTTTPAPAATQTPKLVAMVNEEAITDYDVEQRMKLLQVMTKQEVSKALREKTIEELIDEHLILGEARSMKLKIDEKKVYDVLEKMAESSGKDVEGFAQLLWEVLKLRLETLKSRIRTQISWGQMLRNNFKKRININDREIDRKLLENGGKRLRKRYEYEVRNVLLLTGKNKSEGIIKQRWQEAEGLIRQIKSCASLIHLAGNLDDVIIHDPVRAGSEDLSRKLQEKFAALEIGGATSPSITEEGINFSVLCGKRKIVDHDLSRLEAQNKLTNDKFSLFSRQYLRELRTKAVVERY